MSDLTSKSPYEMYGDKYKSPASALSSSNRVSVGGDTYALGDKEYDIIGSYNFILRVEGFQNIPLKGVRGINKQNEYEYIQEGGLNDYVHMVRKPISQPFTFQVERYVSQDWLEDAIDPLANGTELVLPLMLYMYRSNAHDFTAPSRYYIFTNCRVTGVQIGDLDAEKSGLHTITNTIAYSQLTIVTIPFAGSYENYYRFNKDGAENKENTFYVKTLKDIGITRVGQPLRDNAKSEDIAKSAENNYRGNRTKTEMKALGKRYAFNVGSDAANAENLENTVVQKNEPDKRTMMGDAIKYEFVEKKSGANGDEEIKTINNKNTRAEVQKANRPHANRKFNPKEDKSRSANLDNVENAKSKEEFKEEAIKYKFIDGTNANNENTDRVTKIETLSKTDMEEIAAKNRYEISWDKKNANNINTENVAGPEKTPAAKEVMEQTAQRKKYKFKKGRTANPENVNAATPDSKSQPSKEDMEGNSKKYNFKNNENRSAKKNETEINKTGMRAKAEMYNRQPRFEKQDQLSRVAMEAKARKYPPTRSARDVTEFLNRNKQ